MNPFSPLSGYATDGTDTECLPLIEVYQSHDAVGHRWKQRKPCKEAVVNRLE